jgi:hypothetical protein
MTTQTISAAGDRATVREPVIDLNEPAHARRHQLLPERVE